MELRQIKSKEQLKAFVRRHLGDIKEDILAKPKLEHSDVAGLSFVERQAVGFLRARRKHPVQSELTLVAVGFTPVLPLPIALAIGEVT